MAQYYHRLRCCGSPLGGWKRMGLRIPHMGFILCILHKKSGCYNHSIPLWNGILSHFLCISPKSAFYPPDIPHPISSAEKTPSPRGLPQKLRPWYNPKRNEWSMLFPILIKKKRCTLPDCGDSAFSFSSRDGTLEDLSRSKKYRHFSSVPVFF